MKLKSKLTYIANLIMLTIFLASCNPRSLNTIEYDNTKQTISNTALDKENVKAIATPYISGDIDDPAISTKEVFEVKNIIYDKKTKTLTLNKFGDVVFHNVTNYKIEGNNKVSFYWEDESAIVKIENQTLTLQVAGKAGEQDMLRTGNLLEHLPDFENPDGTINNEALMGYLIDNNSVFAYLIINRLTDDVPWNNFTNQEYSQELKDCSKEKFKDVSKDTIDNTVKVVNYYINAFLNKSEINEDPFRTLLTPNMPYNWIQNEDEVKQNIEDTVKEFNLDPYYVIDSALAVGPSINALLICEPNTSFTIEDDISESLKSIESDLNNYDYYLNLNKAINCYNRFRESYSQDSVDEMVEIIENSPVVVADMLYVYMQKALYFPNAVVNGEQKSAKTSTVEYHGVEYTVPDFISRYSLTELDDVYSTSTKEGGNLFETPYKDVYSQIYP